MLKPINAVIVFLLILLLTSACNPMAQLDSRNCEKVENRMIIADVLTLMGDPHNRIERRVNPPESPRPGAQAIDFTYAEPLFASGPITVNFIRSTNDEFLVDHKYCDGQP